MRNRHHFVAGLLLPFVASGICWANEQTSNPQIGAEKAQLKIEGKFIQSLVLEDQQGWFVALVGSMQEHEVTIHRPAKAQRPERPTEYIAIPAEGQTASLAPGRYRWNSVIVADKGKDVKFSAQNRRSDWFHLNKGETKTLKIGGPLQQKVVISRSGPALDLTYKLLGAGGEEYSPHQSLPAGQQSARPEPPGLSIYKGDAKIHSASFRYG